MPASKRKSCSSPCLIVHLTTCIAQAPRVTSGRTAQTLPFPALHSEAACLTRSHSITVRTSSPPRHCLDTSSAFPPSNHCETLPCEAVTSTHLSNANPTRYTARRSCQFQAIASGSSRFTFWTRGKQLRNLTRNHSSSAGIFRMRRSISRRASASSHGPF